MPTPKPLVVAAFVLAAWLALPGVSNAQSGADAVAACRSSGGPADLCDGIDHLTRPPAVLCRQLVGHGQPCTTIDGREINGVRVDAAGHSWVAKALDLQRGLDDNLPLQEELWTHTHNSFNAEAYQPTLYGIDPNQIYSITDQLRLGIRAIEIDIHWAPSTSGDPAQGGNAVLVCHGGVYNAPVLDHFGCGVNDPLLVDRLKEVRAWMDANPNEVLMLYLENNLSGNATAHAQATTTIQQVFGNLLYRPGKACAPLPMDISRNVIRLYGKRIIITGNCGPGAWGFSVFERGPRWHETSLKLGDDYPAYPCTSERAHENYAYNWIRRWEDSTGLSRAAGQGGDVTVNDARNMVRCGVNMIGLDQLVPYDARLAALVWSWARNEPVSSHGSCAYQGSDGFFHAGNCSQKRQFECHLRTGWVVTKRADTWVNGPKQCARIHGSFGVPGNGWQNEIARVAKGGTREVWLDYARFRGRWMPEANGPR